MVADLNWLNEYKSLFSSVKVESRGFGLIRNAILYLGVGLLQSIFGQFWQNQE